jgi:hypothetical protein
MPIANRNSCGAYCRRSTGLVVAALFAGYSCAESSMKFDELTYSVAEMMGPPQQLSIKANGEVRYESHSSASTPETPEIGYYQFKLPLSEIETLSDELDTPKFETLSDHYGRIAAGDRYKKIVVVSGGRTQEKMVGTSEPIDPGLARVIARLDRIAASATQHPRRALRITVAQATINESGIVTIDFQLAGSGTELAAFVNPAKLAGSPGLSLRGWLDKDSRDVQGGEGFGINLDTIVEAASQPNAASPDVLQLTPGQTRSFHASARLRVRAPETYTTQLIYQNTSERAGGRSVLVGELVSKPFKLAVPALKE